MLNAILFNDTSFEQHHGPQLVVKQIYELAKQHNINIIRTCPFRHDWRSDSSLKKQILHSDLCIVNGEGTMNSDARKALRLGELAKYCGEQGIPCFLINSLYDNNRALNDYMPFFTKIYVRDTLSQAKLSHIGIESTYVPDLTLSYPFQSNEKRTDTLVSCCSVIDRGYRAFQLSRDLEGVDFLSIKAPTVLQFRKKIFLYGIKSIARRMKFEWRRLIGKTLLALHNTTPKNFAYITNATSIRTIDQFLKKLAQAKIVVTGRFHGVTLCLVSRTPFLAYDTKTHKIKALLQELGMKDRLVDTPDQAISNAIARNYAFTPEELERLERFLAFSKEAANNMFAEIEAMVSKR